MYTLVCVYCLVFYTGIDVNLMEQYLVNTMSLNYSTNFNLVTKKKSSITVFYIDRTLFPFPQLIPNGFHSLLSSIDLIWRYRFDSLKISHWRRYLSNSTELLLLNKDPSLTRRKLVHFIYSSFFFLDCYYWCPKQTISIWSNNFSFNSFVIFHQSIYHIQDGANHFQQLFYIPTILG